MGHPLNSRHRLNELDEHEYRPPSPSGNQLKYCTSSRGTANRTAQKYSSDWPARAPDRTSKGGASHHERKQATRLTSVHTIDHTALTSRAYHRTVRHATGGVHRIGPPRVASSRNTSHKFQSTQQVIESNAYKDYKLQAWETCRESPYYDQGWHHDTQPR